MTAEAWSVGLPTTILPAISSPASMASDPRHTPRLAIRPGWPDYRSHPDGFGRAERSRFQPDPHLQHRPERPESTQHGLHVLLLHRRRAWLLPGRMVLACRGLVGRLCLRDNGPRPRYRRRIHLRAPSASTPEQAKVTVRTEMRTVEISYRYPIDRILCISV
jgi:hypothetical protein